MKRTLYACIGVVIAVNLCLALYLINETSKLKDQAPVTMFTSNDVHLPLRVHIEYAYPDKTVKNISTYDNIIDTGNRTVDKAIINYLQNYRRSNLVCNCDAPTFRVQEEKSELRISAHWKEYMILSIPIPD